MFKNLLQFEVFYQFKQRAFPLFAILFLALGVFVGRQGFAPEGINFNAVYQVYFHTSLFTLGSVFIIMFFAISAMLRDGQHQMEGLIFSSSLKKSDYFWSRFSGTFIFSVLAFTPFLLGYILGIHFSNLDQDRIGKFQLLAYLQPWLYFVLPNIFICSTIVFSVSTLTRNSTATYVSAVFVYMLYFVSSIFLNSPLMAQAVPASPESMAIAAVADPFGIAAFFEQTQYWTTYQKNNQLLSFSGLFLWNRLLWILVSAGILLGTYSVFSFRKISKKSNKKRKVKTDKTPLLPYQPLDTIHGFMAQQTAFFSLLKLELKSVFKSLPFIAVLIMWLFIVFSELYSTVISGGEYGVSLYPFTNHLIELIVDPLSVFSLILIVFYSAEIVWKERNLNFNLIIDATPTTNWVFFLSKFAALLLLPIILISTGILMCIIFQMALGYSNYEFSLYASVYYHYGLQLAIFCMIALFVHSLVKYKYMGMGIFGLIVILSMKANMLNLEHPLTSLGFLPRVSYTNMNGFYDGPKLFDHLAIYWFTLGLLLTVLSFKIWNRGVGAGFSIKLKQLALNHTRKQKLAIMMLTALFFSAGSLVFYNLNIASEYETMNDRLDFKENYERKFRKYNSIERLYPTSKKTKVDIYPKERMFTVTADYMLKNKSEQPMSELFITERVPLESITLENANLVTHDTVFGTYLFQYDKPLQPNDSVGFTYKLKKEIKGYVQDHSIINNGTYLNRFVNFEPIFGYTEGLEISTKSERKKRNLPERQEEDNSDKHIVLEDVKHERVRFETIISTAGDQTAISSGRLIKQWSDNNRNFFHYKSGKKILPEVGYFSAKYVTKKVNYKGISIEQYYDENHDFNIMEIENSVKQTLDYCQENFGAYNFDHVRIAEVPSHWSFGGFAHPGMISMNEQKLYLNDVRDEETFNLVAKRTIHEVAHQWWGHTLFAKPVAGGSLFVEGLAKYTEAVVMEKMYGKRALYELSEDARRKYFSGRSMASEVEPPVYKVDGQSFISYGKALTAMLALRDLIGEDQVNQVLKIMTDKYRNINQFELTTVEFLDEIYKVTPIKYHSLIDDWFKKVIIYDLAIDDSSYKKIDDGTYEISVNIKAKRFETKSSGEIEQIAINEPIKIGLFSTHPASVKDESSILYYESSNIHKQDTVVKIVVNELPKYISIDPYGTRSDENLTNNLFDL
ncbi:ABC transporter permease/M1 family aminopeptidase [Lutimonas zeaxanthinifaciens]|uniref:ABC transporter permease/M1 family aminopeptidase n=1 Tax=Lutimonas zeaxanthinifaciens TaxID=3060215 RepID=UPI00265CCC22|nr:M1 family aminopeptidase [Lutimonas sp. YSD2104]WKK64580.1 M1 family aminopeptidase [Lutimonas sp. YSD2104]